MGVSVGAYIGIISVSRWEKSTWENFATHDRRIGLNKNCTPILFYLR